MKAIKKLLLIKLANEIIKQSKKPKEVFIAKYLKERLKQTK